MNGKAFLACVLMSVVLTGCETAKKISQVIAHCSTRLAAHRMTIPFILVPPAF